MGIIVLFALFLTATGAQGSHLDGPQNTLSVVGSNVTLKCLSPSNNCSGIEWLKYIAGNSITVFNQHEVISSAYRERYSVDNKFGCDLIIENVELTDAGRFLCRAMSSSNTVEKTAYLIILETQPSCSINASQNNTLEGDGVHLTCEVTYNGTDRARMVWKGVKDAPTVVVKNKTISRISSAVSSAIDVRSYICIISVAVETKDYNGRAIDGLASNTPNATCETPAFNVLYSVRNVNLSPSFAVYSPGTTITCTADGNPAPRFKWQALEQKINATWQNIPNEAHHLFAPFKDASQYRCVATNVVNGENHTAISTVFQILQSAELISTTTSATPSYSEDRVGVGIGIGFGVGFLVAILLASITLVIFVRLRLIEFHPRPSNKPLDGVVQPMEQQTSPSRQLSVMYASIPESEAPLVSEEESAYASLREARDLNEYASLEEKRKTNLERKSSNLSQRSNTHDVQSA